MSSWGRRAATSSPSRATCPSPGPRCGAMSSAEKGTSLREVCVEERNEGAHVRVTLCITEPGCLMGALFKLTAERELAAVAGVVEVEVHVDHGHVWGPEQ